MPRTARRRSSFDIYHITVRGAGKQTIFEDDKDKEFCLESIATSCAKSGVSILAFCLMSNHFHLLLKGELKAISTVMRMVDTSLAHRYNGRYGHVGPVLQGRFSSTPVETEAHLIEVVRYIHLNPRDLPGVDFRTYPWSSYQQYFAGHGFCERDFVLGIFGGLEEFKEFHEVGDDAVAIIGKKPVRPFISDAEARKIAVSAFGEDFADSIKTMGKPERNSALKRLHRSGISIRQLERLTGIGRGIIQRAVKG